MLVVFVILSLLFFPFQVKAEDPTPTLEEATPTPTIEAPTATPTPETPTSTPNPTATNTPSNTNSSSQTSTPLPTTSPKPTLKKTIAPQQSSGFGGDGLVEDKEDSDGLGSGTTLGTATADLSSEGDSDLLKTLIFLTTGVIAVVWTVYVLLVQKGVIKGGMPKKNKGGITPQPVE